MVDTCTFCGDYATRRCKRKHHDWTIIEPAKLRLDDILMKDGKMYAIENRSVSHENNCVRIRTKQGRDFTIHFLGLPILVKRLVVCDYPACDLHCHKCMRFAEMEAVRDRLLGKTKARSANAGKHLAVQHSREEHRHKKKKPPLERVMH